MDIRRLLVSVETVYAEGGLPAMRPVRRVASCAVVSNPFARKAVEDLSALYPFGRDLGARLAEEGLRALASPVVSYGKAAIIGLAGEVEHAAAVLHPQMGRPIRDAIGGGRAIIPSTAKVAAAGTAIDVPLGDRNDVWAFDAIDTVTVAVPDSPRPDEMVVIVVLSDGGRPRPRIGPGGQPTGTAS